MQIVSEKGLQKFEMVKDVGTPSVFFFFFLFSTFFYFYFAPRKPSALVDYDESVLCLNEWKAGRRVEGVEGMAKARIKL